MRLRTDELLAGLTAPVVVQGQTVCDGVTVAAVDPGRRRLLLTHANGGTLPQLERGPAELAAGTSEGLVRLPAQVVDADLHSAALVVDPLLAEFEGRRQHWRLGLELPLRGQPTAGGAPWSGMTRDVSAGGALVDVSLARGSEHRVALRIRGTELRIGGAVAREQSNGFTAIEFVGLSDAAARALALQLLRAAQLDRE